MTDKASRVGTRWVWYPGWVKSSVSIVLFFLLSGLFLTVLLGALEHSRKLLGWPRLSGGGGSDHSVSHSCGVALVALGAGQGR